MMTRRTAAAGPEPCRRDRGQGDRVHGGPEARPAGDRLGAAGRLAGAAGAQRGGRGDRAGAEQRHRQRALRRVAGDGGTGRRETSGVIPRLISRIDDCNSLDLDHEVGTRRGRVTPTVVLGRGHAIPREVTHAHVTALFNTSKSVTNVLVLTTSAHVAAGSLEGNGRGSGTSVPISGTHIAPYRRNWPSTSRGQFGQQCRRSLPVPLYRHEDVRI